MRRCYQQIPDAGNGLPMTNLVPGSPLINGGSMSVPANFEVARR